MGAKSKERDGVVQEIAEAERVLLEAKKRQDYQQILETLERIQGLQRLVFPEHSDALRSTGKQLWEHYNYVATSMLQQGDLRTTYELLKRAEAIEGGPLEKALTYNNLACYYRRSGKLRTALTYLERGLALEAKVAGADMAQTHLNLCATLSQLGRHERALYHAQSALVKMYETLCKALYESEPGDQAEGATLAPPLLDRVAILCIAYHNLAVEHEYLKDFGEALHAYKEGLRWAWRFLGEDHQICGIIKQSIAAMQKTGGKATKKSLGTSHTELKTPATAKEEPLSFSTAPAPFDVTQKQLEMLTPRDAAAIEGDADPAPAAEPAAA